MFFIAKAKKALVLEEWAAPIFVIIGIALIGWGLSGKGFGVVLEQSKQLEKPVANIYEENGELFLALNPIKDINGNIKAEEYKLDIPVADSMYSVGWQEIHEEIQHINLAATSTSIQMDSLRNGSKGIEVQFRKADGEKYIQSSTAKVSFKKIEEGGLGSKLWSYVLWLTAMVWATMSLSIAISRTC